MTQRTDRIDELLRQEIGAILTREVKDPRIGFATVTRVETTPDLRHARVWVSVIGQHGERKPTIVGARTGDAVRPSRARRPAPAAPDPGPPRPARRHAERGTRVLHLLEELEAGRLPADDGPPDDETLPTPVVRLRHEGDLADEPPPAAEPPPPIRRRRPRSGGRPTGHATTGRRPVRRQRPARARPDRPRPRPARPDRVAQARARARRSARRPDEAEAMTRRPRPWAAAVPDAVVGAIGAARDVLVVSHENPDADTLGAALAVASLVEARGGRATPVCTDPVPALYAFLPGIERVRTDPDAGRGDYDLLVVVDCGSLDRVGAIRHRQRGAVRAPAPGRHRPPRLERERSRPTDWIDPDAAATCEMVGLLAARLGVPLTTGGGAPGDRPHGRHRDGHGDVRPSERHAADAGGRGRARRGRGAAERDLAPAVPDEARRPAPAVRAGPRPAATTPRTAGSSGRR